jgi:hypothetical protein
MTEVYCMNKQITKRINEDALKALATVAKKHGVMVSTKGGKFDSDGCELKFEFAHTTGTGHSARTDKDWEFLLTSEHGLKGVKLGDKFRCNGTIYTIHGCKLRSPVWPIVATGPRGGKYKFKVSQVETGLC